MSVQWQFGLVAACLTAVVLWVLIRALRSGRANDIPPDQTTQVNAAVYREQLAELKREHDLGRLDASRWASARIEIEHRLLQDIGPTDAVTVTEGRPSWLRSTLAGLLLGLPVLSAGLYLWVGQPAALDPQVRLEGLVPDHITPEGVQRMASELRARLEQSPDQPEGWVMLARVERSLERYQAAQEALARALQLSHNPDWAIERAEMLASRDAGNFQGEAWQIIESVLQSDPSHLGALLLAGSAAYTENRYPQALTFWEKASALVGPESPERQPLDAALGQVRSKLGLPDLQNLPATASAIEGRVSLESPTAAEIKADDTVFIYATLPDSRQPLAILRVRAADLPYDFTLDDRHAMTPQQRLSQAEKVVLRARLSRTGLAQAGPDDWLVEIPDIKPGSKGVQLTLRPPR